jgi:hypothetical protein
MSMAWLQLSMSIVATALYDNYAQQVSWKLETAQSDSKMGIQTGFHWKAQPRVGSSKLSLISFLVVSCFLFR